MEGGKSKSIRGMGHGAWGQGHGGRPFKILAERPVLSADEREKKNTRAASHHA